MYCKECIVTMPWRVAECIPCIAHEVLGNDNATVLRWPQPNIKSVDGYVAAITAYTEGFFDGQINENTDPTALHHENAEFATISPGVNFAQMRARRISHGQSEQAAKSRMCVFPMQFQ